MNLILLSIVTLVSLFAPQPPVKTDIALSVATVENARHAVALNHPGPSFYVALENHSAQPRNLMYENCSWGYVMLTLEAVDPDGKRYTFQRAPRAWYRNIPKPLPLAPGETILRPIALGNGTWIGLPPLESGKPITLKVRAILQIQPNALFAERNIWTGRAVSNWTTLTFTRP